MEKIYVIVSNYRPTEDGFAALTRQICDRGYTLVVVDDRAPDADVPPTEPPDERMILLHHARHRGRGADLPIYGTYCFLPIFRRRTGRTVTRAREVR